MDFNNDTWTNIEPEVVRGIRRHPDATMRWRAGDMAIVIVELVASESIFFSKLLTHTQGIASSATTGMSISFSKHYFYCATCNMRSEAYSNVKSFVAEVGEFIKKKDTNGYTKAFHGSIFHWFTKPKIKIYTRHAANQPTRLPFETRDLVQFWMKLLKHLYSMLCIPLEAYI